MTETGHDRHQRVFVGIDTHADTHHVRLEEMTANAEQRLAEAREHRWLGEVSALEESLVHLRRRRAEAQCSPGTAEPAISP